MGNVSVCQRDFNAAASLRIWKVSCRRENLSVTYQHPKSRCFNSTRWCQKCDRNKKKKEKERRVCVKTNNVSLLYLLLKTAHACTQRLSVTATPYELCWVLLLSQRSIQSKEPLYHPFTLWLCQHTEHEVSVSQAALLTLRLIEGLPKMVWKKKEVGEAAGV